MKTSEQREIEARLQRTEAIAARHLHELFQRLPTLSGFWLGPDLQLAELSVFDWSGFDPDRHLYEQVMQSLLDLAEERPEAVQLLRGRTFARVMH